MSARFLSTPSARRATPVSPTRCWTSRFLSTPSARRATSDDGSYLTLDSFLSTPSARRATCNTVRLLRMLFISIHALREEGDRCARLALWMADNFYPRPPRGGRHTASAMSQQRRRFLSTPSARRATSLKRFQKAPLRDFYPRPPRGGRPPPGSLSRRYKHISIHALREEGDQTSLFAAAAAQKFLSTPSARRATRPRCARTTARPNFYPRPPRGGRHSARHRPVAQQRISIHALREEGDSITTAGANRNANFYPRPPRGGRRCRRSVSSCSTAFLSTPSARRATTFTIQCLQTLEFLSTPSARRATIPLASTKQRLSISIHALREEGDRYL